jgi:riboflavin kinase/FMN adenylyltransferase
LDFVERLRGMCRFDTPEQLVAQIDDDVARTRTVFDRPR